MNSVAVTGMGIVSAIGWSPEETQAALDAERSGLGPLTLFPSVQDLDSPVGEVKGDPALRSGLDSGGRTEHLAVWAARQAFENAGLSTCPAPLRQAAGLILGTCTAGTGDTEAFLEQALHNRDADPRRLDRNGCACATHAVARPLGLHGPRATVSTSCTSGAQAILLARDLIHEGQANIMLAGGADALTRLTLSGFASLFVMSSENCRPFDAERKGMNLGEGAAFLVLESVEHARKRGAPIQAYLVGAASTCDAHHRTAPPPDGEGIRRAMLDAIEDAGIRPRDIDYINAHGTGTRDNDPAEGRAIAEVFGDQVPSVSSTKGFFGHPLAAAGAIEAVVAILALRHNKVPANIGFTTQSADTPVRVTSHPITKKIGVALSNSAGFGGTNCCLLFENASQRNT
ncbi:MAG TPA: beta-ketoacyl-[acyl-carrier-protein] synthase family protein [Candidatus Hydrogenedentes bacterium]|nr:beta-ketoacyl-[acyl-carrier-protein] synthase family protein [Candidatus Hydrogenedentota bacterium]HOS03147.1 beta-ketoacyl-[acyl-carrier-protein] synthase family protein [Candidatus Hydrogenedentota bacterium]